MSKTFDEMKSAFGSVGGHKDDAFIKDGATPYMEDYVTGLKPVEPKYPNGIDAKTVGTLRPGDSVKVPIGTEAPKEESIVDKWRDRIEKAIEDANKKNPGIRLPETRIPGAEFPEVPELKQNKVAFEDVVDDLTVRTMKNGAAREALDAVSHDANPDKFREYIKLQELKELAENAPSSMKGVYEAAVAQMEAGRDTSQDAVYAKAYGDYKDREAVIDAYVNGTEVPEGNPYADQLGSMGEKYDEAKQRVTEVAKAISNGYGYVDVAGLKAPTSEDNPIYYGNLQLNDLTKGGYHTGFGGMAYAMGQYSQWSDVLDAFSDYTEDRPYDFIDCSGQEFTPEEKAAINEYTGYDDSILKPMPGGPMKELPTKPGVKEGLPDDLLKKLKELREKADDAIKNFGSTFGGALKSLSEPWTGVADGVGAPGLTKEQRDALLKEQLHTEEMLNQHPGTDVDFDIAP